jgi:hypothetical protein
MPEMPTRRHESGRDSSEAPQPLLVIRKEISDALLLLSNPSTPPSIRQIARETLDAHGVQVGMEEEKPL